MQNRIHLSLQKVPFPSPSAAATPNSRHLSKLHFARGKGKNISIHHYHPPTSRYLSKEKAPSQSLCSKLEPKSKPWAQPVKRKRPRNIPFLLSHRKSKTYSFCFLRDHLISCFCVGNAYPFFFFGPQNIEETSPLLQKIKRGKESEYGIPGSREATRPRNEKYKRR